MCSRYESVILSKIGGGSLGFGVLAGCGDEGVPPVCDPWFVIGIVGIWCVLRGRGCHSCLLTGAIPGVFKRTFLTALLAGGVMNPSLCLLGVVRVVASVHFYGLHDPFVAVTGGGKSLDIGCCSYQSLARRLLSRTVVVSWGVPGRECGEDKSISSNRFFIFRSGSVLGKGIEKYDEVSKLTSNPFSPDKGY
ncbi:hypothetical protein TNCT_33811 [Trichonephila clavata]|uniref:Uncharacterized protein n=1 Tax=Trichonephila clavata TaxID=2740835 RepID=A0A8X6GYD0_TRICU|nr:hypothetical protein TNCT_33811 [Trichonephila clavata]